MAYATQASVEAVLGRSLTTAEQAGLTALLNAVDAYINGQTGTSWSTPTQSKRYYDVEKSRILEVDPFTVADDKPFTVKYVDADEDVVSTVDESDYEARPRNESVKSWLHRRSAPWGSNCPSNVTSIEVEAYFGAGDVPADIAYVASWLAAQQIGSTQSLSLKSESIEGYSRTFADVTKTDQGSFVTTTLERYREILIG